MLKVATGTIFWNKHCLALLQVLLNHPVVAFKNGVRLPHPPSSATAARQRGAFVPPARPHIRRTQRGRRTQRRDKKPR